jgi:DNA-binding winged helix-turn-helix (wHTH) protein/predicted ATPase
MQWRFGPFRLDLENACLWCGEQRATLRPKTFDILVHLVTHAGELVTKEALFEAVWPATAVGDGVLKTNIGELRKVLGDRPQAPQYIVTVHRRGYRFISPVILETTSDAEKPVPASPYLIPDLSISNVSVIDHPRSSSVPLVGRATMLHHLHTALGQVRRGERQVLFITGEPGIGKTSLVQAFAAQVGTDPTVWLASGQCVEHYGTGEAYLPVLEALGQLCHSTHSAHLIALLRQHAPTWLVQMPWLLSSTDREHLHYELQGTTRERMLREIAEVLEVLTADVPLVLIFEDLHWSDYATMDVLARLAQRWEPAQLLLLGTYRPMDAMVSGHPLRTVIPTLRVHGQCVELPLTCLSTAEVARYLAIRFPGMRLPSELAHLVHQRTEGNPLFMVNVVDAWEAQGWLAAMTGTNSLQVGLVELAQDVPAGLQQMLAQQLERLSVEAQHLLEAASVAGIEFSAAAVAAGLDANIMDIEAQCEELVRRQQWLRSIGIAEWPNGTVAGRYAFVHALYHHVVSQRITAARLVHLHRRIGLYEEEAFGLRTREIAAELALHFEHARDTHRAVQYLQQAAQTAAQRQAHREAIEYLQRALTLLQATPETSERSRQELAIHLALGPALMVTRGFAAAEVADTYVRAHQLYEQLDDRQQLLPVLVGLWRSAHVRAQLQMARNLGEQLLSFASDQPDPALLVQAHGPLGQTLCMLGELHLARDHLCQVVDLYEPQRHRALIVRFGYDPGIYANAMAGWVLWLLGYPEQAGQQSQHALALASEQAHPFTLSLTLITFAILHLMCRESAASLEHVAASLTLSIAHGFPYLQAVGTVLEGWDLTRRGQTEEGIAQMCQGLVAFRATGAELLRPYLLALLAAAYGKSGQIEAGLEALEEALEAVDQHAECFYEAALHRLQGELLLWRRAASDGTSHPAAVQLPYPAVEDVWGDVATQMAAETCFQKALDIARHQGAKLLELRAAVSLSRLWLGQGKRHEARQLLTDTYGWFTEGFDTVDLQEAKALLEALQG